MQIQNNLVVSGSWTFQFIKDGLFYINPPNNNHKLDIVKNINCFSVNFMLAESNSMSVLVDLGIGSQPGNFFCRCENSKHILISTKLKQIQSKKIKAIFFSHLHLDHIGNYLEFNDSGYFENFKDIPCYVSRTEWEFRTSR